MGNKITLENVLIKMKNLELKEIIEKKVRAMGFTTQEIEKYFTNLEELIEVVEKY